MLTVERLELALTAVKSLGYQVRMDWLGGSGGGGCEVRGEKWLFVDLAQDPTEQLETVLALLVREAESRQIDLPDGLRALVTGPRKHVA